MSDQPCVAPVATVTRPRRGRYDAIVVGSGVGGSTTAALLAHGGKRVAVLEKNPSVGGILASYRRDGFKFDVGSHLIARGAKGPLGQLLRRLGHERPRFLTHPIPVRSRGIFDIAAPATRFGLLRTALEAIEVLAIPEREALRLARMMFQVFTLTERELRVWERRTLDEFVRSHSEHPAAYFLFSFLASIFFVLPPWEVSAGTSIRALRHVIADYSLSYVEGGMDSIAHALLGDVVAAGGDVVVDARVTDIEPGDSEVVVALDGGDEIVAAGVAANLAPADLLRLVRAEVPDDYRRRVEAIVPSGNAHQLKLALDRPLFEEGCCIGGLSRSGLTTSDLSIELMQQTVADIRAGGISDPIAVYAPIPSNYDASLAPPGCQLVVASLYGSPNADVEAWREHALACLFDTVEGLEDAVRFVEFSPIQAVGRWMGKRDQAAICNGQVPGQVGADRLPVTTPFRRVVLTGDGAGGEGIGTEMAAVSGAEAAHALLQETS